MDDDEIEIIKGICERMEEELNTHMREVLDEHAMSVAINVMVNLGTTMLAKALIMVRPELRPHIQMVAYKAVDDKIDEGHAAVESLMAIGKAKGGGFTCAPWKPNKD